MKNMKIRSKNFGVSKAHFKANTFFGNDLIPKEFLNSFFILIKTK